MQLSDLDYLYPPTAVATEPTRPTRVAFHDGTGEPREMNLAALIDQFAAGDLLVINDTRVRPARIFTEDNLEILFLRQLDEHQWEVLFPSRGLDVGAKLALPGGVTAHLAAKGLPQRLSIEPALSPEYFDRHGEVALPPYIQAARGERRGRAGDLDWYQTAWAEKLGSVAAPTASLHFSNDDLATLTKRGVDVRRITLHVGAGTFLPVRTENLTEHRMHGEFVEVPREVAAAVRATRGRGGRVWALGTTVTRALESVANGLLEETERGFVGETKLFIHPPYAYRSVDALLTNFHQPRSTLLALVAAFAGLSEVKRTYAWAIARGFKLFSYGDLSAWIKPK